MKPLPTLAQTGQPGGGPAHEVNIAGELMEIVVVPIGTRRGGLHSVASGAMTADGFAVIVDPLSGVLRLMAPDGELLGRLELPPTPDGELPVLLSLHGERALACYRLIPTCLQVALDPLSVTSEVQYEAPEGRRASAAVDSDGGFFVQPMDSGLLHRVDSTGAVVGSFLDPRRIEMSDDSIPLRHGHAYAQSWMAGELVAHLNPPSVDFVDQRGDVHPFWSSEWMDEAEEHRSTDAPVGQPMPMLDVFPRTTGLIRSGRLAWVTTYDPLRDRSELVGLSREGDVAVSATVPFYLRFLGGNEGGWILAHRRIDRDEVVVYAYR